MAQFPAQIQEVGLNHGPHPLQAPVPPTPSKQDDTVPPPEEKKDIWFTKEGRILLHAKPPTAYAWGYPWPPCPTNLAKNKVFRPDENASTLPEEVVQDIVQEYRKEAKPFCGTGGVTNSSEVAAAIYGKPLTPPPILPPPQLDKSMVSEIELALYWDRHPFEYKVKLDPGRRAKSAQNLSQVGELLVPPSPHRNGSRRSSQSSTISRKSNPTTQNHKDNIHPRSSSACTVKSSEVSHNSSHSRGSVGSHSHHSNPLPLEPERKNSKSISPNPNPKIPKILQVLSKNEKRQFNELLPPTKQSLNHHLKPPQVVREPNNNYGNIATNTNPMKSNGHNANHKNNGNSIGVQVSLDQVMAQSLKSTYLCPLHGQYRQGIERRSKSGFRTDMVTSGEVNPHAHCSRGLGSRSRSKSRTKMVKTSESQTEPGEGIVGGGESYRKSRRMLRSKTAPAIRRNTNVNMISEHSANYKNPAQISDAENRKLRNKILSYCFTKHSIF